MPEADRADFVKRACGENTPLHQEVESLLASFAGGEDELEDSPVRSLSAAEESVPEDAVDGYRIIEEIRRGGQGVVYRATQLSAKREVALKILLEGPFAGPTSKRRFEREVELAASLRHPGIVPIYDSGLAQGQYYYAMPFISGGLPSAYVREHGLGVIETLELFKRVCDAVSYAHQNGVIHRDLKPSNILVDGKGQPHVLDFGLAKMGGGSLDDTIPLSMSGQVMGTLSYMSPEHAAGRPHDVDTRSDVYSLGVILYELLTDSLPYELDASLADNLIAIQNEPPRRLSSHGRKIDADIETIILKALSKEKDRRYQTAGAFADDIQRCLDGEPIGARRDSALYAIGKAMRRHVVAAVVVMSFLAMMVASSVMGWTLYLSAEQARDEALQASGTLRAQRDDRVLELYFAEMNLAGHAANQPAGNQRVEALTSNWLPETAKVDLRGWEWYYLRSQVNRAAQFDLRRRGWNCEWSPDGSRLAFGDGGTIRLLDPQTGQATGPVGGDYNSVFEVHWNSDGSRIAAACVDQTVRVLDVATGTEEHCFRHSEQYMCVRWHPARPLLAAGTRDGWLRVWESDSWKPVFEQKRAGAFFSVDWGPGDGLLASGDAEGMLRVWNIDNKTLVHETQQTIRSVRTVRWNGKGDRIASVTSDGTTRVSRSQDLTPVWVTDGDGKLEDVDWSPDDQHVITGGSDRMVRIRNAETGFVARRLGGHAADITGVAWHPRDHHLATLSRDKTVRLWPTSAASENRVLARLRPYSAEFVAWNPHGDRIAVCGSGTDVFIFDVATGELLRTLSGHEQSCRAVNWHHDGRLLLSSSFDEAVIVWDTESGEIRMRYAGHEMPHERRFDNVVHSVDWSPEGDRVVSVGHARSARSWHIGTGQTLATFDGHQGIVDCVDWHPVKPLVVSGSHPGRLLRWNPETGEPVGEAITAHSGVVGDVQFSPNGLSFVSAGQDGGVRLWETSTGRLVRDFSGHLGVVRRVRWMHDGTRLASCSDDGTIKVWCPDLDSELLTIKVGTEPVMGLDWSPDGRMIVSTDQSGLVQIWDASHALDAPEDVLDGTQ